MASNGASAPTFALADVVAAVTTMRTGDNAAKKKAHEYLEKFQKSNEAWPTTLTMLKSPAEPEVQLFAAVTLRGKVKTPVSISLVSAHNG
jgi:transportin-3